MSKFKTGLTILSSMFVLVLGLSARADESADMLQDISNKVSQFSELANELNKVNESALTNIKAVTAANIKAQEVLQECKTLEDHVQRIAPDMLVRKQNALGTLANRARGMLDVNTDENLRAEQSKLVTNLESSRYCKSLAGLLKSAMMQK